MEEAIPDNAFQTCLISLVVVQDDAGRFVSTHEHDGWYLPAGRVDFGETFATGAKREALEEAGVPVTLTGLLRLEHTPGLRGARMRAIYTAVKADDTPLKSEPDDEVIEASWVTLDELKKKPLRSDEVVDIFSFAASGTRRHPPSIIVAEDSAHIDHKLVVTFLVTLVDVIIKRGDSFLAKRSAQGRWEVPRHVLNKAGSFRTAAVGVIHADTGIYLGLDHIVKIYHKPPANPRSAGSMRVVYVGHLLEKFDAGILDSHESYKWFSSLEEFMKDSEASEEAVGLLQLYRDTPAEDLCSPEMIALEMDPFKKLS